MLYTSALAFFLGLVFVQSASAQRQIPVNIQSNPAGASVFLDSTSGTALGVTPLANVRVAAGAHTLIFRLANYEEARMAVTVARRRETFRAELRALGSVELSAGNDGARGASVTVDGQAVGGGVLQGVPLRVDNLPPGRHQISATRDGYNPFQQWVDVQGGQVVRATILLERSAPTTGSVLVTADVEGAPIFIDGRPTGMVTTAVIDDVPAGNHSIEIRPLEGTPFTQSIVVMPGQRAEVRARIRAVVTAPVTGTIAVLVDQTGAIVRINGTNLPSGSYSQEGLAPGNYVVQVLLEGFEPYRREVVVVAGQTNTVDVQLTRTATPPGQVNIRVNVSGATVNFDGVEHTAPAVIPNVAGGTHSVRITAPGYQEQSFTCSNSNGATDCDRAVTLVAQQVGLRVSMVNELRPGETARVFVDDVDVGPVPYDGNLSIGSHVITIRAEGYEEYREQVNVQLGEGDVNLSANLVDSSEILAAGATTHSALPTPLNHPTLDVSLGWPNFLEMRLGIGVHELVDAGISIRTFGRLTEFEGRVRVGTRLLRQIAVGGQARFGGGIGPDISLRRVTEYNGSATLGNRVCNPSGVSAASDGVARDAMGRAQAACANQDQLPTGLASGTPFSQGVNTFFLSLDANVSLLLEPIAAVTLWLGVDLSTDQYAGHARNSSAFADYGPSADAICREGSTTGLTCSRQDMARLRLGGSVEFNIDRNWGVFGIFEGVLAQSADHRRLYSDIIGQATDIRIYPRLGVTYKF
jgi:hypothetical protein